MHSPRRRRPEELTEMNPSNPLQTQPEIGNDYHDAASAVSPNSHHQEKKSSLFSIDHAAKPVSNAAQMLEDQHFEDQESQQPFFDCLTQVWHQPICLYARRLEEYRLVWATKLLLAAIGLVFPALVLGYKSFNCSMYHVPVPMLFSKFV
jgi:hypothetical protein